MIQAHVRALFDKLTVNQMEKMEDTLLSWARAELESIPNSQEVRNINQTKKLYRPQCLFAFECLVVTFAVQNFLILFRIF